jgi:hypothetical protein
MDSGSIVLVLLGGALLGVAWVCWTGRWRGWAKIAMLPAMPIAAVPGLGLCLLLAGLAGPAPSPLSGVLIGIGVLASLAGLVIAMWDPDWYGPRWFRERDRAFDPTVPVNAAVAASVRPAPRESSEAVARARMRGEAPAERWRAHLVSDEHGRPSALQRSGLVRGSLLLYPDALVFAADAREDEMRGSAVVEVLPASSVVAVEPVPSRSRADGSRRRAPDLPTMFRPCLRVDTDAGAFVFETSGAGRRAQELASRYARGPAAPAAAGPLDAPTPG